MLTQYNGVHFAFSIGEDGKSIIVNAKKAGFNIIIAEKEETTTIRTEGRAIHAGIPDERGNLDITVPNPS